MFETEVTGASALPGHLTTAAGSVSSFSAGLWALATNQPSGQVLATLGTLGGALAPIVVAYLNKTRSREIARLRALADERAAELGRERAAHNAETARLFDALVIAMGRNGADGGGGHPDAGRRPDAGPPAHPA